MHTLELFEEEDVELGWVQSSVDHFTPQFFSPPLVLMDIPKGCSTDAAGHLAASFGLFFSDPGAALNSARAAVEAVVTDLGIKRYTTVNGKRKPINLHQRILRASE